MMLLYLRTCTLTFTPVLLPPSYLDVVIFHGPPSLPDIFLHSPRVHARLPRWTFRGIIYKLTTERDVFLACSFLRLSTRERFFFLRCLKFAFLAIFHNDSNTSNAKALRNYTTSCKVACNVSRMQVSLKATEIR